MRKKFLTFLAVVVFSLSMTASALAYTDWENCVWISMDLDQQYKKMGFFRQDEVVTRITSEFGVGNTASFDITIGNTIIEFSPSSGLYGQLGINSREKINLLFGGGYIYQNPRSDFRFTVGARYYIMDQVLTQELEIFYRFFTPFILNLSYDDYSKALFIGLGITFS